jgi:predicted Zn-dependent protease
MLLVHTALMKALKATLLILFLWCTPVHAQGMTVIRDTEIEQALRAWSTPIWQAAGLNPDAVDLVLVQSDDLNAFVAGGSNIFIYTGLIDAAKSPDELLGVIAHETGHIAGGHLIQGRQAMERASYEAMLAGILGIGAAATGNSKAAGALIIGGQGLAVSGFLSHSRVQESSADQAALTFMERAQYNPSGLARFLGTLKNQELLPQSRQNSYVRTHPLTAERIDSMLRGIERSKYANTPYPADMIDRYARIKAKLLGFINPSRVDWVYSEKDTSTPALYARAIAAYKRQNKSRALDLIDQLIAREPQNPWFYEVKGQMLRDFSQIPQAIDAYRRAVTLAPDAALIRVELAQVLLESASGNTRDNYAEAEKNLDLAFIKEQKSTNIQRLYATLYGRMGQEPRARYHLAEEAALQGDITEAKKLLTGALPQLDRNTKEYRRAMDLKVFLDAQPEKTPKRKN